MLYDFMHSLQCLRPDEVSDYRAILNEWERKADNVAFMPAIDWNIGTYNLLEQRAGINGGNMIWLIPAGQSDFWWFKGLEADIVNFYETDEIEITKRSPFPGIEEEEFEECILLHSDALPQDPEHTIMGANVILVRFSLSSGRDALLFILLAHQDQCWKHIIEGYRIALDWFVDSNRGTDDYYVYTNLYQLMKQTEYPDVLPRLYFRGRFNKGPAPAGALYRYSMLSEVDADGYDRWRSFSAVYDLRWDR